MSNSIVKAIIFSKPMIIVEIGILIVIGFSAGKEYLEKRAIEEEIAHLETEIGKLENQKDDLGALIKYVRTDAFVQQQAREKLNLTAQGESVVVIPEVDADSSDFYASNESEKGLVLGESSLKIWWEYFFDQESL
ncbi:hypothetical protein CL632_00535 [bacterium]|jgi:cell division protein FtsB|nr:hypothetical protein [bacterium]MDP6571345.1 septum formation initiator family protein [Patescibacteria group bacterium]MDP6756485.1 septum formation initiator family protein [Patescibacteria group bacterium]|tara:strand:+ start:4890 stop:5294 length:405 start_codon:yes stop_codon:yes gene_type:complete